LIEPARLAGSALLHTQSDERLVDLTRAGNDRAFEAIVARYRRPLLRYSRRLLPAERAEDAVQQAFLNAYRAIGAGEAELNLRPWLYRVVHNASLSLLRQNGWSHEELDDQFDGVQQPPQAVEQSERLREVVRAVQDLPERQRNAMVLRELEGRSYEEIATTLGVSGGAVRQLLNRARTNLRAAATAVTPFELAAALAARGQASAPLGERIAELCAGAGAGVGGLAGAAKLGTALVVAGAVAGGTTGAGPLPDVIGGDRPGAEPAVASDASGRSAGADARARTSAGEDARAEHRGRDGKGTGGDGDEDHRSREADDESGEGEGEDRRGRDDDRSGSGGGDARYDDEPDDDRSGSSGSGSGGSGSSGDDSSGSGSSGSGSGGSGGSDDDLLPPGTDPVTSGSDTSGSGTSGSGSGSGTSGSGSSGSSGSGSGRIDD
jgi:RNA polymerase sigma factor (sigma-70 family)